MTMISRKKNPFFRNRETEINVPLEKFPLLTRFLLWLFAQLLMLQAFKAVADVFLENIYINVQSSFYWNAYMGLILTCVKLGSNMETARFGVNNIIIIINQINTMTN